MMTPREMAGAWDDLFASWVARPTRRFPDQMFEHLQNGVISVDDIVHAETGSHELALWPGNLTSSGPQ